MVFTRFITNITSSFSFLLGIAVFTILSLAVLTMADEPNQEDASSKAQASKADTPKKPGEIQQLPFAQLKEIKTESGVKYWDIKVGNGISPKSDSRVRVHASGWLKTGTLFWSSHTKGESLTFLMSKVIQGWRDGMLSMKEGGVRRLEIPPNQGYGKKGMSSWNIPPDATLIFEVELLEVIPDPTPRPVKNIKPVLLESGLKYWDFKVGNGASPGAEDRVEVEFSAWIAADKLFDSSTHRDIPSIIKLKRSYPGWVEGLTSMKVGGERLFHVPSELAYGKRGRLPIIPPDSDLVFEVKLLDVIAPPAQRPIAGITPITTPSGLKYWDIRIGDGDSPNKTSTVLAHYSGWLQDGKLFHSTIERGPTPVKLPLKKLIEGWKEGLISMKVGGLRRLEIPYNIAYGEKGNPPTIPPKSNLIFEVELLGIVE